MLDIVIFCAGFALICAPGVLLWSGLSQDTDRVETWTWGATLGLAAAVLLAFYVAQERLSWFWLAWPAWAASSLVFAWRSRANQRSRSSRWLIVVLALVAISRFAPTLRQPVPLGWDPSFHLILARKLLDLNHVFSDWRPFAPVQLNYPLGSHLLVAVLSQGTHLPLTRVFQWLLPALGVLSTAQIFCLACQVFGSEDAGLFAAIAYGFWAYLGSIGYSAWGGLPNELGMVFLVGVIATFANRNWSRPTVVFGAVCLAAAVVVHHHVTLVAGGVVAISLVARMISGLEIRKPLLALALMAVAAAPEWVRLAERAMTIANTNVLHNTETMSLADLTTELGLVVVGAGIAGIVLAYRERRKESALLVSFTVMLIAEYFVCGPLFRAYSEHRFGQPYVMFAPSRFLTDLAYFLSIFAGYATWRFATSLKLAPRTAMVAALLLGLANLPLWRNLYIQGPDAGQWQAFQWIQHNTAVNAVVDDGDSWACYASWRRTPAPPIPDSEPRPPEFTVTADTPTYSVIAPGGETGGGRVVWTGPSGWSVAKQSALHLEH